MTERFKKSVDKLSRAYIKGELLFQDCSACAVGNLCDGWVDWGGAHWIDNLGIQHVFANIGCGLADEIKSRSGYSYLETARIERAFESAYSGDEEDPSDQFKGLMAVVDVLAEIDNIDLTAVKEAKEMFVNE